jgi:N-acetylneuraminate synthase
VAVASIALGACVIEKHFTLARSDGGPDAAFSLEPAEFTALVTDCKRAWQALGKVGYELCGSEGGSTVFRRSLYVVADVAEGETLTRSNIRSIRPGYGLAPKYLPELLGRKATRPLKRGSRLTLADVAPPESAGAGAAG